ncbi:MAG: DNA translocase FtsK 4TM domain-containing protein, partial [Chitinophagales bacterium]
MAKSKRNKESGSNLIVAFFRDERTRQVSGVLLVLCSFFLVVAFISDLFTWKQDQDLVWQQPWKQLFNGDIQVENHLGKLGAVVGHQFFYRWFGIGSFFFTVWF